MCPLTFSEVVSEVLLSVPLPVFEQMTRRCFVSRGRARTGKQNVEEIKISVGGYFLVTLKKK